MIQRGSNGRELDNVCMDATSVESSENNLYTLLTYSHYHEQGMYPLCAIQLLQYTIRLN